MLGPGPPSRGSPPTARTLDPRVIPQELLASKDRLGSEHGCIYVFAEDVLRTIRVLEPNKLAVSMHGIPNAPASWIRRSEWLAGIEKSCHCFFFQVPLPRPVLRYLTVQHVQASESRQGDKPLTRDLRQTAGRKNHTATVEGNKFFSRRIDGGMYGSSIMFPGVFLDPDIHWVAVERFATPLHRLTTQTNH